MKTLKWRPCLKRRRQRISERKKGREKERRKGRKGREKEREKRRKPEAHLEIRQNGSRA